MKLTTKSTNKDLERVIKDLTKDQQRTIRLLVDMARGSIGSNYAIYQRIDDRIRGYKNQNKKLSTMEALKVKLPYATD